MSVSAVLQSFKEKIEDAAAMVRSMDAEEKLQAVEYWNIVSEQLQIIVNHSAEDLNVSPLDCDKLPESIDASHLVALGLSPAFLTNFVSNNCLDVSSGVLSKLSSKDVQETIVIATSLSETGSLPSTGGGVIVDSIPVVPTEETVTCQTLSADRLLNVPECEAQHVSTVVHSNLINPGVVLDESVNSETLDNPDSVVDADNSLISQASTRNSVQVLDPSSLTKQRKKRQYSSPLSKVKSYDEDADNNKNRGEEQFFKCSYCMRTFFTSSQLTTHTWTHTKPYVCSVCHSRFSTKGNLSVHIRRHSGERPYVCALCLASFSTRGNLLRHRKAHSGEKPWQCGLCSSRFTEKKSLNVHMRRHTGERPYRCSLCPKAFSQAGVLQAHLNTHLDKRAFSCPLCGKSFRQKSQLRLHERRHAGLRKYECSVCSAKFHTRGDMERHNRIHTGERPFVCKLCQKSYTRQQSLNEHMNRHYGLKPYRCKYCEKGYVEMSACYKHIKTHERSGNTLQIEKNTHASVPSVQDEDIHRIFEDSSENIHRTDQNSFFMEELI